jgi:hypothetical protein
MKTAIGIVVVVGLAFGLWEGPKPDSLGYVSNDSILFAVRIYECSTAVEGCGVVGCLVYYHGPTYHWEIQRYIQIGRRYDDSSNREWTDLVEYGEAWTGGSWSVNSDPRTK